MPPIHRREILILVSPTLAAIALAAILRVALHYGEWEAFPLFGLGLILTGFLCLGVSIWFAARGEDGFRFGTFVTTLVVELVVGATALQITWLSIPLSVSGP